MMGINVILWNYWGYGHSTKSIWPYAIKRDGVLIANYYKKEFKL